MHRFKGGAVVTSLEEEAEYFGGNGWLYVFSVPG